MSIAHDGWPDLAYTWLEIVDRQSVPRPNGLFDSFFEASELFNPVILAYIMLVINI